MEAVDVSFCAVSESTNEMVVSSNQDDVHDSKLESKVEQDLQDYAGGESVIQKASSSDVESEKQHFSPDTNVKNPVGSQNHEESLCLSSSSRVSPKQDDPSTCKVSDKSWSHPEETYESGQNLPEKVPEDGNEGHLEPCCFRTSGDSSDQDDTSTSKVLGNMQTICEETHESGKSIPQAELGSAFNISETIKNVPKVSESAQNYSDKVMNVPEVSKKLHSIPEVSVITLAGDSKRGECFHKEQTKSTSVESQEKNLKTSNTKQSDKDNPSTLELQQSHACKVELAGETSVKKRKLSHLSKTEPAGATCLKRSNSTKVDVSDNLKEELDDPDFVLPVNTFSSKRLRRKKPVTYTNVKSSYACSIEGCGMIFTSLTKCNKHEKEDHQGLKYECRVKNCQDKFTTKNGRTLHERLHKDIFECNHCELAFSSLQDRCFHMKVHASFVCGFKGCQKIYTTERQLLRHRKTHTGERTIKCQHCPKAFFTKKQLNDHKATHRAKIHPCDFCGKLFKTNDHLKTHERQHTGKNMLVCQYCGKNLKSRPSLERHERLHTGERPFQCKHCDKRFVCIAMLQNHEQEHTGYQFVCAQCGDKFKTKNKLQEHERIHTGEKPEKCEHCSECFRTKGDLWRHRKVKHSKTKEYVCSLCCKAFALRTALNKHQTVHTGERNYECKYCHKKYSSSNVRSDHIKHVHLGVKRTGHQGKVRRLKEEAKNLAEHQYQVEDSGDNVQLKLEAKSSSDQSEDL